MLLLFDWDETISAQDTLSLIAPPEGRQHRGPAFSHYTESYLSDLSRHDDSFGARDTLARQTDYLASIDAVERASVARVEEGGLFDGVTATEIEERARSVRFRTGWEQVAEYLRDREGQGSGSGVESHIISVGWSARFIRAALAQPPSSLPPSIPRSVHANEVEMDTAGKGTGRLTKSITEPDRAQGQSPEGHGGIRTGIHKREEMRAIVRDYLQRGGTGKTVYVGDSNTDLPCLLEADVGLLIGGSESARKTCERVGVVVLEGGQGGEGDDAAGQQRHRIRAVKDWYEALEVIKALE